MATDKMSFIEIIGGHDKKIGKGEMVRMHVAICNIIEHCLSRIVSH